MTSISNLAMLEASYANKTSPSGEVSQRPSYHLSAFQKEIARREETPEEYFLRLEEESRFQEESTLREQNEELKAKLKEAELKEMLKGILEAASTEYAQAENDQKLVRLESEVRRLKQERNAYMSASKVWGEADEIIHAGPRPVNLTGSLPPVMPRLASPERHYAASPGYEHAVPHSSMNADAPAYNPKYDPVYGYDVPPALQAGVAQGNYYGHPHPHMVPVRPPVHHARPATSHSSHLFGRLPALEKERTNSWENRVMPPFEYQGSYDERLLSAVYPSERTKQRKETSDSTTQSTKSQESGTPERNLSERGLIGRKLIQHLDGDYHSDGARVSGHTENTFTGGSHGGSTQSRSPELHAVPENNMMVVGTQVRLNDRDRSIGTSIGTSGSGDKIIMTLSSRMSSNVSPPKGMALPRSSGGSLGSSGKMRLPPLPTGMPPPPPGLEPPSPASVEKALLKHAETHPGDQTSTYASALTSSQGSRPNTRSTVASERDLLNSRGNSNEDRSPRSMDRIECIDRNRFFGRNKTLSVPPPPAPKELSPEEIAQRDYLAELCARLGVEQRTVEWFCAVVYAPLWGQMIDKIGELSRRKNGEVNVKNPAAWLTKFFNIIRVDPDEPARNRAMRNMTGKKAFLGSAGSASFGSSSKGEGKGQKGGMYSSRIASE